jgi:hypothetical protein
MTRKLETLFDLPSSDADTDHNGSIPIPDNLTPEQTQAAIVSIDTAIDKIDAALPAVHGLESSDDELDELADLAKDKFNDLMDLGMQVDSRFASEIFSVAGAMLGHALTAKTAKLNKKLKMIDLQLRKARLDQQTAKDQDEPNNLPTAEGHVLDRNELLARLIGDRSQKTKKE